MRDAHLVQLGGTMRTGCHETIIPDKNSLAYKLYNKDVVFERYRHRFEVNLKYREKIEKQGMKFTGLDESGLRMEILELPKHPYFVGVQFHPEFLSRNLRPSPPFLGLIKAMNGTL